GVEGGVGGCGGRGGAGRQYGESALAAREMGSVYWDALGKLGVAVVLGFEGDLARAEPIYDQLLLGFRLVAPKHNTAYLLYYLGELRRGPGGPRGARPAPSGGPATPRGTRERVAGGAGPPAH